MKKTLLIIIIILLVGIGIYYLVGTISKYKLNQENSKSESPLINMKTSFPVEKDSIKKPTDMIIRINDSSFIPSILTIRPGTKVTWVNNESVTHTVISDAPGLFESGNILPRQSYSTTFLESGTILYHCSLHPNMKGRVIVVVEK